ncbi:MAG: AMIN domain-containing protein, partial [Candidatus Acidiferrales bacterium]
MMRNRWGGLCAAIVLVGLISLNGMSAPDPSAEASPPVRLLAVGAPAASDGSTLEIQASGPFSFTSYQPHPRGVIVDLAGVVADPAERGRLLGVDWVAGYRVLPFRNAGGRPVLRLELSLTSDCEVRFTQAQPASLRVACPTAETKPVQAAPAKPAVTPAAVQRRVAATGPVTVSRVRVGQEGSGVVVNVEASGPVAYEVKTLSNPTRLVIDLPEAVLQARQRQFVLTNPSASVVGVRVGQFKNEPPVTRLVVDLLNMIPYEVDRTSNGLRVTLQPAGTFSKSSARRESPKPAAPAPEQPEAIDPVLVASLAPMVPAKTGAVTEPSAEPVETAMNSEPLAPAPTIITPAPAPAPAPLQAEPTSSQGPRRYSGEPISVNLKDVDLKDFFRLVHEISGLNIIVDPNVKGTVTMVLIDVPWDQALDIVLKNNSLGSTLEGNVLRIAALATLKKEQEEQRELAKARAEAVDPVTVTRTLSYARAADMETTLKRFLSSRGELIRDERTNTVIIRDIPTVIPEVDNLLKQLDRKSLQVEIEARVVSASRAFSRELGSQFATSFSTTGGRSIFGGAVGPSPLGGFPIPPPLISTGGTDGAQPLVSDFRANAATSGFLFGHRSPNFAIDTILTAAESRNIAKILSKPRLVTQNNITAEVKQGTKIPVQTVVNNTISTQYIDVVLRLNVTPQITAEGTVFLNIIIENTAVEPGIARINGIPALATQSTTTQVLIPDGGTVVVGGVMVTNNSTSVA